MLCCLQDNCATQRPAAPSSFEQVSLCLAHDGCRNPVVLLGKHQSDVGAPLQAHTLTFFPCHACALIHCHPRICLQQPWQRPVSYVVPEAANCCATPVRSGRSSWPVAADYKHSISQIAATVPSWSIVASHSAGCACAQALRARCIVACAALHAVLDSKNYIAGILGQASTACGVHEAAGLQEVWEHAIPAVTEAAQFCEVWQAVDAECVAASTLEG